jgi:hypothetical protein
LDPCGPDWSDIAAVNKVTKRPAGFESVSNDVERQLERTMHLELRTEKEIRVYEWK